VIRYGATVVQDGEGSWAHIEEIFIHPRYGGYGPSFTQFDVAVVKTEDPMSLRPGYAELTFLANPRSLFGTGTNCLVFGFGSTGYVFLDSQPRRLRTAHLTLRDLETCRGSHLLIEETVICGFSDTNYGPCSVCETNFAKKI
jgi:Trypsin